VHDISISTLHSVSKGTQNAESLPSMVLSDMSLESPNAFFFKKLNVCGFSESIFLKKQNI